MGAYNVANRARLASGQPEDVSDVLANLDLIAAVLNGGIDNSNINAAAAVALSKLAGYPTDGTKFAAGDGTWKVPPGGGIGAVLADVTLGAPANPLDSGVFSVAGINSLRIIASLQDTQAVFNAQSNLRLNGDTTTIYYWTTNEASNSAVTSANGSGTTSAKTGFHPGSTGTAFGTLVIDIPVVATARQHKWVSQQFSVGDGTAAQMKMVNGGGYHGSSVAITRVQLISSGTSYAIGSRLQVIGYP